MTEADSYQQGYFFPCVVVEGHLSRVSPALRRAQLTVLAAYLCVPGSGLLPTSVHGQLDGIVEMHSVCPGRMGSGNPVFTWLQPEGSAQGAFRKPWQSQGAQTCFGIRLPCSALGLARSLRCPPASNEMGTSAEV